MVQKIKAPAGTGARDTIVKSRYENKREPAKRASPWAASEKFNEQLFSIKLSELPPLPRIDGSFFPTNAAVDNYLVSLHERLEGVDRICRRIWQIKGEPVTPEFVREVLERKVMAQIDAVEGASVTRASATDLTRWGHAWAYLAEEVGNLKSGIVNRYTREIEELAPSIVIADAEVERKGIRTHRKRGPDLKTHSERAKFEDRLRSELGAIRDQKEKEAVSTVDELQRRFSDYRIWTILSKTEQDELLDTDFKPRAYARELTASHFGVTTEAIKKSRQKLLR